MTVATISYLCFPTRSEVDGQRHREAAHVDFTQPSASTRPDEYALLVQRGLEQRSVRFKKALGICLPCVLYFYSLRMPRLPTDVSLPIRVNFVVGV